jgi:hypothetical protein
MARVFARPAVRRAIGSNWEALLRAQLPNTLECMFCRGPIHPNDEDVMVGLAGSGRNGTDLIMVPCWSHPGCGEPKIYNTRKEWLAAAGPEPPGGPIVPDNVDGSLVSGVFIDGRHIWTRPDDI